LKLAIVCSWLNQYGGAERVLEVVHDIYPEAPVYTSIYWPRALPERYRSWDIRPSFLNHLPLIKRWHRPFLPLYPLGFESFDLREYEVVLSVTSAFAHGVITSSETQHVCYCLTPARFLWNYHSYVEREGLGRLGRLALPPLLERLRLWDRSAADRVDQFIAISSTVQRRIRKHYGRDSQIIYPPVKTNYPDRHCEPEDYFLVVSRLVPYKRIDLAVCAFNRLGLPLRIVGDGRDRVALEAMAEPNIQFLGYLSDAEVREQMLRCRAFVFPGEEDFGLAPLEAMAAGGIAFTGSTGEDYAIPFHNSMVLETSDPREIEAYIMYLEEYPEEKERIRKTARRTARQFTWEEVIGNLIQKLEYQARIQGFLAAQEGFPHPN